MRKLLSFRRCVWALLMAVWLLIGCHAPNPYGLGNDTPADMRKALTGVVSYLRQHGQQMPYLQERNFTANDLLVRMAICNKTDDTVYVKIPFVRAQCDSLATADSLYFAPRRMVVWGRVIKGMSQPEVRFIELEPTRDYHKANRNRIWYRAFSGEMNFFTENGFNDYSMEWVNGHVVSDTVRQVPVNGPGHGVQNGEKIGRK